VSGVGARGPREFCRRRCLKHGRRARTPQDPRELGNLCPKHHDLVTNKHYTTTDNHDGTWDLHAPAHAPVHTPPDAMANAPPGEAAA
jgi:hypothetical protein